MNSSSFALNRDKIFIGGFGSKLQVKQLTAYFSQFGKVKSLSLIRDNKTGLSKGFGFVRMVDPEALSRIFRVKHHWLDDAKIDIQLANNKNKLPEKRVRVDKETSIFIGGVVKGTSEAEIKEIFEEFGVVTEVSTKFYESKTKVKQNRGFGFLTFQNKESVSKLLAVKPKIELNGSNIFFNEIRDKLQESTSVNSQDAAGQIALGPVLPFRKFKAPLFTPWSL